MTPRRRRAPTPRAPAALTADAQVRPPGRHRLRPRTSVIVTTTVPTLPARPEAARARTPRLAHAPLAPRRAGRAARGHRRPLPLGPVALRLGQRLLLGRGAGRRGELEGVVLRLVRRRELRSPSTRRPRRCGSSALSVRIFGLQQLEHPRPAGAHGRRVRRAAVRGGQARSPGRAPGCSPARRWP